MQPKIHSRQVVDRQRVSLAASAAVALCGALSACQSIPSATDDTPAFASALTLTGVERCEALAGTRLGFAAIEDARPLERGDAVMGVMRRTLFRLAIGSGASDLSAAADFCRITAKLRTEPGSEITAEIWLPQQWNGKLVGIGGGGLNGGLVAAAIIMRPPLEKGYIGVITDAGHSSMGSGKFAHDSAQQYADFAYRANHVAAGFAKALAAAYYRAPVKRAYFHGCSNGGRDALMLARRYPQDYDGIIAGAPAAGWSKFVSGAVWNYQATRSTPKLRDKLKLVQDAVLAKCDALDGVKDGLLENPASCPFDPAELQCKSGDGDGCLNADEVAALGKIYAGPRLRDGTRIYAGMTVGGEALPDNWEGLASGKEDAGTVVVAQESIRWMVYGEAQWDADRFDLDRDYPLLKDRMAPIMDSDDPDLSAYMGRGGKLLLYHGWNDSVIPAGATLDYYATLRKALGPSPIGRPGCFMVPGVMHCGGGVGPNMYDLYDVMDRWVEGGAAPERITATEYDPPALFAPAPNARVVRTRPLCPWPKVARYAGSGSTDDQSNFNCQ